MTPLSLASIMGLLVVVAVSKGGIPYRMDSPRPAFPHQRPIQSTAPRPKRWSVEVVDGGAFCRSLFGSLCTPPKGSANSYYSNSGWGGSYHGSYNTYSYGGYGGYWPTQGYSSSYYSSYNPYRSYNYGGYYSPYSSSYGSYGSYYSPYSSYYYG